MILKDDAKIICACKVKDKKKEMDEALEQVLLNCYENDSFALQRVINSWDIYQAKRKELIKASWTVEMIYHPTLSQSHCMYPERIGSSEHQKRNKVA